MAISESTFSCGPSWF